MVTAQLTDVDNGKVEIGQKVEMVTRKLRQDGERGMLVYGYKFRPAVSQRLISDRFSLKIKRAQQFLLRSFVSSLILLHFYRPAAYQQ